MDQLTPFFEAHLSELYVVYGVSFLIMGIVLYLQPKDDQVLQFAPFIWLISAFGIVHGVNELFDWWQLSYQPRGALHRWFDAGLLLISYVPLLEFGRRIVSLVYLPAHERVPRWPYVIAILGIGLMTYSALTPQQGLIAGARGFVGFPGAILTGWGLLAYRRRGDGLEDIAQGRMMLTIAGAGFLVYGALAALAVVTEYKAIAVTAGTLDLPTLAGVPTVVFRALCAIVIALSLARLLRGVNVASRSRERRYLQEYTELTRDLEQRVSERTAALARSNRQLEAENTQRRLAEEALKRSEANLHRAQAIARLGSWYLDVPNNELMWSAETYRIFGIPQGTPMSYEAFLACVHPQDRSMVSEAWAAALGGAPYDLEHRIEVHGKIRWVRERAELEFDEHGELKAGVGTVQDITERKEAYAALEEALENLRRSEHEQRELRELAQREQGRMAALLSAMNIGILFEDRDSRVEYVNPAFRSMWGIPERETLEGKQSKVVLEHSSHRFARPDHASRYVLQVLDTHEVSERFEIDLYDGRILTQISYPVMDADDRLLGRLWIYEDITNERQTAQQLLYLAERDALTGLYNRHRFQEQLEQSIVAARRGGSRFALLYFDLDEFKYINDTFGHRAGDAVLVRTANEIYSLVRGDEMLARLGGDEFALLSLLLPGDDIEALAMRIVKAVSDVPYRFRGRNLRITTSVGVAIYPDHGDNAEDLVAHADAAMYQAKHQAKNTWAIYDPNRDTSEAMVERMSWNQRIIQALQEDQLELHFQGVYKAAGREFRHLEALVRMRDATDPEQHRLIMPGQFIPIAEKTGVIVELDRWVLKRSVQTLQRHPHLPALAVNISGRTFDEPSLPHYIRDLLSESGVDARRLIIELTETSAVSDMQDAQRFIDALRQMGCQVCLDDFGSGFATFTYLKHLGVQILKIDGQFIRDLPNHPENQAFVKAMVDVARGLRKTCVAEFVEDSATLQMVAELGVELAQGYHLDRPSADHPALRLPPLTSN